MCNAKLLHSCCKGYVIQCKTCNHMQFAFGTIAAVIDTTEFDPLRRQVEEALCKTVKTDYDKAKEYIIKLPIQGIVLMLDRKELSDLHDLLEMAGIVHEVNKILNP